MAITGNVDYVSFAKDCLVEAFQNRSVQISGDELTFWAKCLANAKNESGWRVYNFTADKMQAFIKERAFDFAQRDPRGRGCDLSCLPQSRTFRALTSTFDYNCTFCFAWSFITNYFFEKFEHELAEDELNLCKKAFGNAETSFIARTCYELYKKYEVVEGEPLAAYYLFWLLKLATQGEFEIPAKEFFANKSKGLKKFREMILSLIKKEIPVRFPFKLVEILFLSLNFEKKVSFLDKYGHDAWWKKLLWNDKEYTAVLNAAEECLLTISKDVWPAKWHILANFLLQSNDQRRADFLQKVSATKDDKTHEFAIHLNSYMETTSLEEETWLEKVLQDS
jgi:hypothetical protein